MEDFFLVIYRKCFFFLFQEVYSIVLVFLFLPTKYVLIRLYSRKDWWFFLSVVAIEVKIFCKESAKHLYYLSLKYWSNLKDNLNNQQVIILPIELEISILVKSCSLFEVINRNLMIFLFAFILDFGYFDRIVRQITKLWGRFHLYPCNNF